MDKSLLQQLTDLVESTVDSRRRALAQIDLGICLAQLGRVDEAMRLLDDLRLITQPKDGECPDVMVGMLILEGVIGYYHKTDRLSIDRMRRAQALAQALGLKVQSAQSNVWLMFFSYIFDDFSLLNISSRVVFANFHEINKSLQARACLVVADAAQLTGLQEESTRWYAYARHFARDVHDHAVMVAIENNRLSMGQARLRIERLLGIASESVSKDRNWAAEVESVRLLHYGLGSSALEELSLWCQAQLHQANGRFQDARALVLEIKRRGAAPICGTTEALLDLEALWCTVRAGEVVEITTGTMLSLDAIESLSMNDQLVAAYYLKDISELTDYVVDEARLDDIMSRASEFCRDSIKITQNALRDIFPLIIDVRSGGIK